MSYLLIVFLSATPNTKMITQGGGSCIHAYFFQLRYRVERGSVYSAMPDYTLKNKRNSTTTYFANNFDSNQPTRVFYNCIG